jgi:nucleoside-diphosphate-sugar epimerase
MASSGRSRGRVLITGANGYIGAQAIAKFLREGWTVRGAVRDPNSTSVRELASHFAAELSAGTFELVVVPNIIEEGAFDEAVRGVTAIAHLATPVVFDTGNVEYVIGTAVRGTLSILESALRASSGTSAGRQDRDETKGDENDKEERLKSFVFMSSAAAVRMNVPGPITFTEADWNTQAEAQVKEAGDSAFGHVIYAASKVASERAFWDWVREKKPPFAATALCPW